MIDMELEMREGDVGGRNNLYWFNDFEWKG